MVVYTINGYPRSGKDTFCKIVSERVKAVKYSTVDIPKKLLIMMGWNGEKTLKIRKALSDLKDMYTELFDGPFTDACHFINNHRNYDIVFIMCREPKEIARLKYWCVENNIKCGTIFIERDVTSQMLSNHADINVEDYNYDLYISNNGSLDYFRKEVLSIVNKLLEGINA